VKWNLDDAAEAPKRRPRRGRLNSYFRDYSVISVIRPAPIVRPPSRMAKRCVFSIAIGLMSSISTLILSPGMIISTPLGRVITPVTSVVRK